jgi:hypothetical protein
MSEAHAMMQQVQDQIEDAYTQESDLSGVAASDRFAYLPPAGMLPLQTAEFPKGFDPLVFFGQLAPKAIATMDGAAMRSLFAEALNHDPIDVSSIANVQFYVIIENYIAVQAGSGAQLTLVFASKYLTRRETARFNFANFGAGRFATNLFR